MWRAVGESDEGVEEEGDLDDDYSTLYCVYRFAGTGNITLAM